MSFDVGMQLVYFTTFLALACFEHIRKPSLWLSFSGAIYAVIHTFVDYSEFGIYVYVFKFAFDIFIISMLLGYDEYIYCKIMGIKPATASPINSFIIAMTTIIGAAVFLNGVSIVEYDTPAVIVYNIYTSVADGVLTIELLIGGIFCVGNFINLVSPDFSGRYNVAWMVWVSKKAHRK